MFSKLCLCLQIIIAFGNDLDVPKEKVCNGSAVLNENREQADGLSAENIYCKSDIYTLLFSLLLFIFNPHFHIYKASHM